MQRRLHGGRATPVSTGAAVPQATELPGYAIEQKFLVMGDGSVAVEWVMTGTDRATGTKFSARGVSIMDLRRGKIRRNSDYWNMADFQRQVGQASGNAS